jgi:hypothetical protein
MDKRGKQNCTEEKKRKKTDKEYGGKEEKRPRDNNMTKNKEKN